MASKHSPIACVGSEDGGLVLTWFEFGCIVAGAFFVQAYFWLMDDAFVYFRYVDNYLFLDLGLVNNYREYVEGYSSPAWALLLILLRSFELEYPIIIRLMAGFAHLFFSLVLVALNRHYSTGRSLVNSPLLYLTCCYGVMTYFTSGLESPLVMLMAIVFAAYITKPDRWYWAVLIGLGPMVRHEILLAVLVAMAWGYWRTRRFPWLLLLVLSVSLGAWLLFRVYYYAELLPNTFYLKNTVDPWQGLTYVHDTLSTYNGYAFFVGFAVLSGFLAWRGHKDLHLGSRGVMIFTALLVTVYVIKIGGDARHFRFLAFPFCLAVCATSGLVEKAWPISSTLRSRNFVLGVATLLGLFAHLQYPPQLSHHPLYFRSNTKLTNNIAEAHWHRVYSPFQYTSWCEDVNIDLLRKHKKEHAGGNPYEGIQAGAFCYQVYINYAKHNVHGWGLTSAVLARVNTPWERPAHRPKLLELAKEIKVMIQEVGFVGRGMYRAAVEKEVAPPWVKNNLSVLEVIERKVYNEHHFWENLRLAFSFPPRLNLEEEDTQPTE